MRKISRKAATASGDSLCCDSSGIPVRPISGFAQRPGGLGRHGFALAGIGRGGAAGLPDHIEGAAGLLLPLHNQSPVCAVAGPALQRQGIQSRISVTDLFAVFAVGYQLLQARLRVVEAGQ